MKGCNLYREDIVKVVEAAPRTEKVTKSAEPAVVSQVDSVSSYTIHFGLGKSDIPSKEKATLEHVMQEIKKYAPSEITVSGYASTLGSKDYNQVLSEKRAQTVAHALADRGINPEIIHQKAYGETHLEVPTADGVKMPPNRRVVIEFNH
jgi:outer membrane protein OmpA-like peptidoglycan-associated protein